MSRLVSVTVPVPFLDHLTYRVPEELKVPVAGARVLVPLGTRTVTGCVVSAAEGERDLKDLIDVLDAEPFLPPDVLELALWVADYYACGSGEAIAAVMPPYAWLQSERRAHITDLGRAQLRAGNTDGMRGVVLSALASRRSMQVEALARAQGRRLGSRGVPGSGRRSGSRPASRRGVHALVTALAKEGLVAITQPLRGRASAFRTVREAALTAQGRDLATSARDPSPHPPHVSHSPGSPQLGARQREVIEQLRGCPDGLAVAALGSRGMSPETVGRLARRGLVTIRRRKVERDPFATPAHRSGGGAAFRVSAAGGLRADLALTREQDDVVRRLGEFAADRTFRVALLHGVTGSGKTEIYLRLARIVHRTGRSVLVLVPEIALTPAVTAAFRQVFSDRVAIQHSGLSDGERHDQWHRIRGGEVDVVVGTRSAVFAPLSSLGLIIVDEEHDGSYKQEESPRYNARDVAVMRGKRIGALVVLGSATPSMESYQNALVGRYERVTLTQRVFDRPLASVQIVDMREEFAAHGPDVVLSERLRGGLADRLERGEQSLVLLNRRGFASAMFCRQCASALECPNCSVSLTLHRDRRRALCHYCNYSTSQPKTCPRCAGPYLEQLGFGTERVEAEVRGYLSGARVARLDRDSARRRGAASALLHRFAQGEIDILIGTQMIAKGHDFPRVTLVGVVSADVGLGLADFRAAERTFQLLTQVAGRAGRGTQPGEAIIQTLYPNHYSIRYACHQEYAPFFEEELRFRRGMRYPPLVSLINALVRAPSFEAAMNDAADLAAHLRSASRAFRVLGPAPAPLGKLRGEHRAQLFLKGTHRTAMREALRAALAVQPERRRRVMIDVDPLSVL